MYQWTRWCHFCFTWSSIFCPQVARHISTGITWSTCVNPSKSTELLLGFSILCLCVRLREPGLYVLIHVWRGDALWLFANIKVSWESDIFPCYFSAPLLRNYSSSEILRTIHKSQNILKQNSWNPLQFTIRKRQTRKKNCPKPSFLFDQKLIHCLSKNSFYIN